MSAKEWEVEIKKGLCRCCHSEGSFKSLSSTASVDSQTGKEEEYLVKLRNCLAIELSPVEDPYMENLNSICELCITRLEDAHSFKQQVIKCEQAFQDYHAKNCVKDSLRTAIKQELPDSENSRDSSTSNRCVVIVPCEVIVKVEVNSEDQMSDRKELPESDAERPKPPPKVLNKKRATGNKRGRRKIHAPPTAGGDDGAEIQPDIPDEIRKNASTFTLLRRDYKFAGEKIQCARCDKIYNTFKNLRSHLKHSHFKIARFSCKHCTKKCHTLKEFKTHNMTEHGVDNRCRCDTCDATFITKRQLRRHIANFHMLGQKLKCPHCDYEGFCVENLARHKLSHNTVKEHRCKYCNKLFLRRTTMVTHEKIHTGDRRKVCPECGQAFVQKSSLNYHMTKYHPDVKS